MCRVLRTRENKKKEKCQEAKGSVARRRETDKGKKGGNKPDPKKD